MKLFSLVICLLVGLGSLRCHRRENEVVPVQELFPIDYHFVNESLAPIRSLNMTVYTYFPKANITDLWYQNFLKVSPQQLILMRVDTTASTRSLGYVGCIYQMEINTHCDINDSLTYISTWFTKADTITSKQDAQIFFHWPSDTLNARKTEGYYNNRKRHPYFGE